MDLAKPLVVRVGRHSGISGHRPPAAERAFVGTLAQRELNSVTIVLQARNRPWDRGLRDTCNHIGCIWDEASLLNLTADYGTRNLVIGCRNEPCRTDVVPIGEHIWCIIGYRQIEAVESVNGHVKHM